MKKVLVILLLFLPFFVKADLTKKQEENMTFFVTNFVSEGNKRLDKNGYSLLAYVDENNCIYGYQSKLFKLEYDYNKSHYIDSYKWTFDDSSFISFMYLKTFNLILTRSNTSKIDPYSGLNIKSETAKPYQLSDFLDDASKEEHFYIAYEEIDLKNEIESLKPGDLIIINEHIMLYLGDGMIAHASSDAISESKLGIEVTSLKDKYYNLVAKVLRIKDKIINPEQKLNTLITWIDTNETIDLLDPTKRDLSPKIAYVLSTEEWAKTKELSFTLTALNGLKAYSLSSGEDEWEDISGESYNGTKEILENGTYYLKIKDQKEIVITETIEITKIDNKPPVIEKLSATSRENYSILEVVAKDYETSLADKAYSFDGGLTWSSKSSLEVTEEKEYTVLVKDKFENIATDKLYVYVSNEKNPSINNVIYGESEENVQKVTITILNCNGCKIATSKTKDINDIDKWDEVSDNTYVTHLEKGTYYVYLKNSNGENVDSKKIKVSIESENIKARIIFVAAFIQIVIVIFAVVVVINRRNNKI